MRSLRRAVVVLLLLATVAACGSAEEGSGSEPGAASSGGRWEKAPDVPLSPRTDPFVVWTGEEVLVVGGNTGWICPPTADCTEPTPGQLARDGAAWNPTTREWRKVASAPAALWSGWSSGTVTSAVLGDSVVLRDVLQDLWFSYDVDADAWVELASPGEEFTDLSANDGQRVWAVRGLAIVAWDPATGRVTTEVSYDEKPRLGEARLFVTDAGLVVTGHDHGGPAPDEPTLTQADVREGDQWRRVVTGQVGWFYHWTGERIIGYEPGSVDGGEVNGWDRAYPFGGALDPRTGEWVELDVPVHQMHSSNGPEWDLSAAAGSRVVTSRFYRDLSRDEDWLDIGRPESDIDHHLNAVWADGRLVAFGGVDAEVGWEAPAIPELWVWTPGYDAP